MSLVFRSFLLVFALSFSLIFCSFLGSLWGSPEQGLVPPVNTTNVPLFILKTANATIGHYGDMAGGQPFCE